jgi:hypothetical protein
MGAALTNYVHHSNAYSLSNLNNATPTDRARTKLSKVHCWVCGCDVKSHAKFCPPCSIDVTEARTNWRYRNNKKGTRK